MANLQEFRVERHPSTIPQLIQSIGVEFLAFSSSHDHLQVQKNSKSMEMAKKGQSMVSPCCLEQAEGPHRASAPTGQPRTQKLRVVSPP